MAATLIDTALAIGQLPIARDVLYTVPIARVAVVNRVSLTNTGSVAQTVNIYVNTGSNVRRITPKALSLAPGYMLVLDDPVVLSVGWTLEGDAASASTVDYVVSGSQ